MENKKQMTCDDYIKLLVKEIDCFNYKHNIWDVWQDWLSMMAISISNSVEYHQHKEREETYKKVIAKYDKDEMEHLTTMFHYLIAGLQVCGTGNYRDVLGELYHTLNLNNKNNGEFFTPLHISDFMAEIQMDQCEKALKEQGYVSVYEPTCGSGVMIIAFANALMRRGYDVSKSMVAVCTDINSVCVNMCYIQLSLIGVPAVVIHGNTLTVSTWNRWYTPLYVWRNWLCNLCGVETPSTFENSAAYIQSWINALKGDKYLIVSASGKAQKAVDFILNDTQEDLENENN